MYEVFDSFCKLPTWDTSHALDEERFRTALSEVVHLADFSPEEMGRYIQLNHAQPIWPRTAAELNKVVDRLVEYAALPFTGHEANLNPSASLTYRRTGSEFRHP